MSKTSFIYFILFILIVSCSKIPDAEVRVTGKLINSPSEVPRTAAMYVEHDGFGYVFCGRQNSKMLNDVWRFDPETHQWEEVGLFPGPGRVHGISASNSQTIFVGLGYANVGVNLAPENFLRDFYKYNFDTSSWIRLADFPTHFTNGAFAYELNDFIYVSTGFFPYNFSQTTYRYDTNKNEWEKVGDFNSARSNAVTASSNGRVFAGTGYATKDLNDWHEYIPNLEIWRERSSMPDKGRISAISFGHSNYIYVGAGRHWGGGSQPRGVINSLYQYDINTDEWRYAGRLPGHGREAGVSFSINGKFYYGFGEDDTSTLTDFYLIDFYYD
jgi:N-acetylneuraminic acid mutarotase